MILIGLIVTSFLHNISVFADIGPDGIWPYAGPLNYENTWISSIHSNERTRHAWHGIFISQDSWVSKESLCLSSVTSEQASSFKLCAPWKTSSSVTRVRISTIFFIMKLELSIVFPKCNGSNFFLVLIFDGKIAAQSFSFHLTIGRKICARRNISSSVNATSPSSSISDKNVEECKSRDLGMSSC